MKSLQTLKGNRRKAAGVFSLALAVCLLLFLPGCQGPLGMRDAAGTTGDLSLTIEGPPGGEARTALPGDKVADFERLVLTFAPGTGNTASFGPITKAGGLEDNNDVTIPGIPVGLWNLTVTAYLYDPDDYYAGEDGYVLKASYTTSFNIAAGADNSATISLNPVEGGYGDFSWTVTFPAAVTALTVEIFEWPGMAALDPPVVREFCADYDEWENDDGYVTVAGVIEGLAARTYWAVFTLEDDYENVLPIGTILRVYRNMVSVFDRDFDFDPATNLELAIAAIEDATWTAVSQPWDTGTTETVAAALANVRTQVETVVGGLVPVNVNWAAAAPTITEAGLVAVSRYFTVVLAYDTPDEYTMTIPVSVGFLRSNAHAATQAINAALATIQAQHPQMWLDYTEVTLNAALAVVQGRVNTAIATTGATATVSWVLAPSPDGTEIGFTDYGFTVAITGSDGSLRTGADATPITVSIRFVAAGVVDYDALEAAVEAADLILDQTVASTNGVNVSMAGFWVTEELHAALYSALEYAEEVLAAAQAGNSTPVAVEAARSALVAAYNPFIAARRAGRLELVTAHGDLAGLVANIAPQYYPYTVDSWAPVASALLAAGMLLDTYDDPLCPDLDDGELEDILQKLEEAYEELEEAFADPRVLQADYNAVLAAFNAVNALLGLPVADEYAFMAAVNTAAGAVAPAVFDLTVVDPALGANGSIIGTITLQQGNASRTVTIALPGVTIPMIPGAAFTIVWAGFANPLDSVTVSVDMNGAGGTLTLDPGTVTATNVRWYEGLNRLGTGPTLTRSNMPPVVTVWAEVGDRTYSLVVDVNNPPTGDDD